MSELTANTNSCSKAEEELIDSDSSIVFLGLNLHLVSYRATLSEQRMENLRNCVSQFHLGKSFSALYEASVIAVVAFGLLFVRDFQIWVASLRLNPSRHLHRKERNYTNA